MKTRVVAFAGCFEVWSYTVGHGCLLLRSTKSAERQTQVDILFKDVGLICLPARFDGCTITEIEISDLPLRLDPEIIGDRPAYRVTGSTAVGYVVAGTLVWDESDREYHERSRLLEFASVPVAKPDSPS